MATSGWQKTIAKLRAMDRRELLDRTRQAISQRADAALARFGYDFATLPPHTVPHGGAFFFRPDQVDTLLQIIRQRIPQQAEAIVARAEKICAHRFDLLGYDDLDFGDAINWHLDPVHGKTAPRKSFHRIKYLDFLEVGDSKVTWELNRHQHLVTLAKAYRLTGQTRFADEILAQWRGWHSQNPYPIGINWASSLEVAFRSLSWIWTYALLEGTPFLTAEFRREYLRGQAVNGRHLERYLSTYFSPNTHLLGEAVALFFLGTVCSGLKGAQRWRSRGWQIVLEESAHQVNSDGLHFEQSTYYHVYALDFFLHAGLLASVTGLKLPKEFEETLERTLNALFLMSTAGTPPRFGDDDGGRLFDPARNRDEHLIDPLSTGAILFRRGDFKTLCPVLREESIWLAGEAGVAEWDSLETKPARPISTGLDDSGIFILAAPESPSQLIVKSGPRRAPIRGHAHADALSLCLQGFGRSLLIDPGTCEYVGEEHERNLFRGTPIHNTLTVDGQDQSEPAGPFSWKQDLPVRNDEWIAGQTFDLFAASHSGYTRLAEPVRHQRWVIALKPGIFLVRDVVEGDGEHRLELSWRLHPDLQMIREHLFRIRESSPGLVVLPVQSHGWTEEVHKGPYSPVYGVQRKTTVLKFARTSRMPAEFAFLLVSLPEANSIPGTFVRLRSQGMSDFVNAYRYQTADTEYRFLFGSANQPWICGPVASDAAFVCLTLRSPGQSMDVAFCNGSYLEVDGKRVMTAARPVTRCEVMDNGEISCSNPDALTIAAP
jgi:hypothetical protein